MKSINYSFSKNKRVRKRDDFIKIFSSSGKYYRNGFILRYKKNNLPDNRIGIIISKKFGNAVERNRIRRIIRETFRQNQNLFIQQYDLLVILNKSMKKITNKDIAVNLIELFSFFQK